MLKIAWSEIFAHSLPEGHRFPMAKYDLLPEQLLYEGTITQDNLFAPEPLEEQYILDTHDATYWQRLRDLELSPSEIRKTGFPLSKELVQREIVIMNGTLQAALFALEYGIGMNIAGGTHHAFTDRGEGFCLLNDIAIATNHLLRYKGIKKVLVVDLDVHQGNG
ncbi:MAG: histone deacetylase, partial [Hymenobacteraceae bacterium]|nr:histone deacetylase [Hymenobacteraceae bacterium]